MADRDPTAKDEGRRTDDEGRTTDGGDRLRSSSFALRPILILGLGNPLQADDGVGCRLIEALATRELPSDVEALDGGAPGIGLINLLEGRRRVIIVDAAEMGRPAGAIVRFRPEEVTLTGSAERFSLHRTAVADALALARALDLPLPEIIFFGVQPGRIGWSDALGPEVAATLPALVEAVLAEARREAARVTPSQA